MKDNHKLVRSLLLEHLQPSTRRGMDLPFSYSPLWQSENKMCQKCLDCYFFHPSSDSCSKLRTSRTWIGS